MLSPIAGPDSVTTVMTLSYYQDTRAPISRPVWGNIAHLLHDRFCFPDTDHEDRGWCNPRGASSEISLPTSRLWPRNPRTPKTFKQIDPFFKSCLGSRRNLIRTQGGPRTSACLRKYPSLSSRSIKVNRQRRAMYRSSRFICLYQPITSGQES